MSTSADLWLRTRRLVARGLGSPLVCLWLVGWLAALLIQTGSFATIDTRHRYQVTRWLWRGEPEVSPGAYPDFGILDPDGGLHAWYGIGQSLLMFPGDVVARLVTGTVGLGPPLDVKAETGIVALLTFPALTGATLMLGYLVLLELGVERRRAAFGTVAWLFATTCLAYAQAHFENSMELAALLAVFLGSLRWARSGRRLPLLLGTSAGALAILARLPLVVDVALCVVAAVAIALPPRTDARGPWLRQLLKDLLLVAVPILLLTLVVDRAYQVARFGWGSLATTYVHIWGEQYALRAPGRPANYAFSNDFWTGFWGPLVDRNKSVFLYDPLLLVAPLLVGIAALRRKLDRAIGILFGVAMLALLWRVIFYAKFIVWYGGSSWSDRYALTPVQLGLLLVVPVFLELRATFSRPVRTAFWSLFAASVALQLASVLLNVNLEIIQSQCRGGTQFVLRDRFVNLWRLASGTLSDDGCSQLTSEGALRLQFLPWSNGPELPASVRVALELGWFALLVALAVALWWTFNRAMAKRQPE